MRGDFSFFLTVVIFIVVAVVRTKLEADKLKDNRPRNSGDGDPPPDSDGKDIAVFLEDLRRRKQLAEDAAQAAAEGRQTPAREPVVRPYRIPSPTPTPPATSTAARKSYMPKPEQTAMPLIHEIDMHGAALPQKHGLAHPVFSADGLSASALGKRAILLQEVLGTPVGLREPRRP